MKLLNQILNKISSNKFNQVHTSLGALSLIASAMNKDEDILNSFCVLAFDEVPNKNFTLKEYVSRKADSKKGLNLVEKHLIAKEVSKYLKDASAFYDSELVGKVEKQANFKRPENVNILKSASFGNIVLVNNKYHLVNPLTKNVTAEYIKIATEPNLLKLNNIINSAKLNNGVKDWGIENGIWLISGDDAVINDLEHKIKDEAGYYCEAINQSTGIEGETPMYSLKIFIGNVSELDQNTDNKFSSKEENIDKKAEGEKIPAVQYRDMHTAIHHLALFNTREDAMDSFENLKLINITEYPEGKEGAEEYDIDMYEAIGHAIDDIEVDYRTIQNDSKYDIVNKDNVIDVYASKKENIEKKADEENSNTADEKAQAVKQLTGVDAVSANYDYYGLPTYTSGDKEYSVASDENEVYRAVVAEVESLLDEIGYDAFSWDNMGGIEKYVDTNWFDEARDESNISYARDIAESEPERFKEEASEYGITVGEEVTDDIIDAFAEKMKENQEDNSVEWFINNFGKEAIKDLMKDGRITFDTHAIADEVINLDGPGHVLSGYDGKEVEQQVNGKTYFLYRQSKKNGGKVEKTAEEKINFEKDLMEAGESKGEKDKVNETQLEMGKEVEKEHTTNPEIAEKITRDHLEEIPDYYTHLKEMEENAKENDAVKSSYAPFITIDATKKDEVKVIAGEKIVGTCKDVKAAFEKSADWSSEELLIDDGTGVTVTYQVYDESELPVVWAALRHRDSGNVIMCSDAAYVGDLLGAEDHIDFLKDIKDFSNEFAKVGLDEEKVQHYQDQTNAKLKEIFQPQPGPDGGAAEVVESAKQEEDIEKKAEDGGDNVWVVEKTSAPTIDDQLTLDIFYVVNKNTHVVAHDAGFEPFLFPTQEDAQKHADKLNSQKEASAKPEVKKEAGESYDWYVAPWEAHEKLDLWIETVGMEKAFDDLRGAINTDELSECLAFIFRNNDFPEGCSDYKEDVESSKKENIETQSKVVKEDGKYQAQSEKGKSFGTYDTKEEAEERVKQMEMFKHMNNKSDKKEDINKKADEELKQFDMKQELDGQKEFEKQDDFSQVSVPEEKEDTSEVTETMEAKPEETKGESFSASEFGNNMAYIQQNNPDAFKSIMNNLKQLMVGDQQKIYNFLENWSSHNFQDFTAMTREDPTYARHSQYQEQLKNNVLPKLKEMSEYKQAMEEKVSAEKGNVEASVREYDSSDPEDAAVYNHNGEDEGEED